jgi:translation initiation factor IF-2
MRVFELAKELELTSKDVLDKLRDVLKVDVRTHMTLLTPDQIQAIKVAFGKVPPPPDESAAPAVDPNRKVVILKPGQAIIVREFAEQLHIKPNLIIAELMGMNIFASINQKIELRSAQQIAAKHGYTIEHEKKAPEPKPQPIVPKKEKKAAEEVEKKENVITRAPVVVFMGHVDHGKTSLLDKIRNAKVAAGEAGGITQHIGAYTVTVGKNKITFLDTPGHEAFTAMRARGANLTDIAVVVVDGVDGVMPQTKEAIQHAKAAEVSLMVALNKKDLRAFNADRVKQQLQALGVNPEDWGGDVICCPVSALTGDGVDNLLENIAVQAEVLELQANPRRKAQGYVVEAQREPGMGPTATLLIRDGTLNVGDAILCGPYWGRVKALITAEGKRLKSAGPSDAVKCLGLSDVPEAGAEFIVADSERAARETSESRLAAKREQSLSNLTPKRASLEDLMKASQTKEKKELNLLVKVDAQGSLEALQHAINNIKSEKVTQNIVLGGVGNISANDVLLASASNAIILGFHVSKDIEAAATAKREGVEIRLYSIIYELLDELREAMQGLLDPIVRETVIGHAKVKETFDLGKKGKVAGCIITDGKCTSRSRARVKRKGEILHEGTVTTLRRFQNEASEVREGQECGIRLERFGDFEPDDIIELYEVEKIAQQL